MIRMFLIGLIDYKPLVVLDESILKGSTRMNKSNLLAPEKYILFQK